MFQIYDINWGLALVPLWRVPTPSLKLCSSASVFLKRIIRKYIDCTVVAYVLAQITHFRNLVRVFRSVIMDVGHVSWFLRMKLSFDLDTFTRSPKSNKEFNWSPHTSCSSVIYTRHMTRIWHHLLPSLADFHWYKSELNIMSGTWDSGGVGWADTTMIFKWKYVNLTMYYYMKKGQWICESVFLFGVFQASIFLNGLNTEIYSVPLRIQSECGKYGPEKLRIRKLFRQCKLWIYYGFRTQNMSTGARKTTANTFKRQS